ncbi:MAG: TadE/TadG family type IV pilus assembly protein [Pseudomonadota bacterium]
MCSSQRNRERGTATAEFVLILPLLFLMLCEGVHLGKAIGARHSLAEATNVAVRAAAVNGALRDNAVVKKAIKDRAGANCSDVTVVGQVVNQVVSGQNFQVYEVTAGCNIPIIFGELLGEMAIPKTVEVKAAYLVQ